MPKQLTAREPLDALGERQARKPAHSVHAPADAIRPVVSTDVWHAALKVPPAAGKEGRGGEVGVTGPWAGSSVADTSNLSRRVAAGRIRHTLPRRRLVCSWPSAPRWHGRWSA